jgi:peptide deformylase
MIITNNEEALRVKCDEVSLDEVGTLIDTLESELKYANRLGKNGIGLAAPQIGIAKNIAIIRLGSININLINCKLQNGFDPKTFKDEGCLSFPGRVETTTRFQEIHVSNNLKYPNSFIATGLIAVVCQHELDHLNSVLFMDHKIQSVKLNNKPKPNTLCICGSNKKYKKCCGK